jgi:hypothetical protein
MGVYTHTLTGQESQAVESLPDLSLPSRQAQQAIKTGTDDTVLPQTLPIGIGRYGTTSDNTGQAEQNNLIVDNKNALSTVSDGVQNADQRSCYPAR